MALCAHDAKRFVLSYACSPTVNVNPGSAETLDFPCETSTENRGVWGTAPGAMPQTPLNQRDLVLRACPSSI